MTEEEKELTPEMKALKKSLGEEEVKRTTLEEEAEKCIAVLNLASLDKGKIYIIQLSDEWLDKMGGKGRDSITFKRRLHIGKNIGLRIVEFLQKNGIKSTVLIGEAMHIYDTEKKNLKEVLKDVRDRRTSGKDNSEEEDDTQTKLN